MTQPLKIDLTRLPELVNPVYYKLLANKSRYLVLKGGGSSGKSVFSGQKHIYRLLKDRPRKKKHRLLVVRKVKADLRDSCFEELKNVIDAWDMNGLFYIPRGRSSDLYIRCELNGNEIIFYGLDDVERRKSIAGITGIWVEEASEIDVEDFRQLDIRLRDRSEFYQQMILSFNPVNISHWLKKEFFDTHKPDATVIETTYKDNRFLRPTAVKVLEGFKGVDDYYYNVYCLGNWGVLGKTVYSANIVSGRIAETKLLQPLVGRFVYVYEGEQIDDSSIKFIRDDSGPLRVYEQPQPGVPYVIGADTAEGGEDYCTGSCRNNLTWNQAATWRERTDTDLFAKQLYCLGKYFNEALIGIETNFDLHPVKELDRLGYNFQYMREVIDSISQRPQKKHGFKTTKLTRPAIISQHVALARDHIDTFNDSRMLNEMLSFVRNENGKPEAQQGQHDDMIFADAIALEIREQQTMTTDSGKSFLAGGMPGEGAAHTWDFTTELDLSEKSRDEWEDEMGENDGPGFYSI